MYKVRKGEIEKQVTSEVGMPLLFEENTSYHDQLQIYICIGGFCESFKHKKSPNSGMNERRPSFKLSLGTSAAFHKNITFFPFL